MPIIRFVRLYQIMSFTRESKLKNILYDILCDIKSHNESREEVLNRCVNEKLDVIRHNHTKKVSKLYKFILAKNNIKILKAINKLKKESIEDE